MIGNKKGSVNKNGNMNGRGIWRINKGNGSVSDNKRGNVLSVSGCMNEDSVKWSLSNPSSG